MYNHIAAIEQHPSTGGAAFISAAWSVQGVQLLFDRIGDRLYLAGIPTGADDKVIRNHREFTNVERDDIGRLLINRYLGDSPCQLRRVQPECSLRF